MAHPRDIAVLVGSLRKDSLNRRMAHALEAMAPAGLSLTEVPTGDLPHYNADVEGSNVPRAWSVFRERVKAADP